MVAILGAEANERRRKLVEEEDQVITAFIATGAGDHAAPFFRQGTGTINMLVLAMLSQIAEDKQNVIFAMEEAETAIPPYAQKRIVHELRKLSAQSLFTSLAIFAAYAAVISDRPLRWWLACGAAAGTGVLGFDDEVDCFLRRFSRLSTSA